ncbi:MAG: hypothetical protein U9N61_10065 [Euryarchaeota archaeon]|nr:hypothetical protein [Euryarchaeota archaeon]
MNAILATVPPQRGQGQGVTVREVSEQMGKSIKSARDALESQLRSGKLTKTMMYDFDGKQRTVYTE